ncbi:hypothetical protein NQ315_000091 [Exocentrus adspersus]|uniref:DUF229 domain containing protein n=1 Tax=Exocentrus adspersus TaxID=1586481 RepID=A0AAV8VTF6_9CUCU|nr:hypothetical protein NQ315_000091 [Exocentrus adspersus]
MPASFGKLRLDFILNTNECKIPYFPAFSKETNETFQPQEYTNCFDPESSLLTFVEVNNNTIYLHLDEENEVFHGSEEPLTCCYSYVTRNGTEEEPDVGFSLSECTPFNTTVQLEENVVMVKCERDSIVVYENVHSPITITREVHTKLQQSSNAKSSKKRLRHKPISVLIIVIDSVSRLNFKRTMPSTRRTLLSNGFTEFIAYNKIDDNTFPNFMALLSGMNLKQVYSKCDPKEIGKLDECPMIWYDFRDNGYVTAYAEDWPLISTFNYNKKGFQNPPTDYYFKTYLEAAESLNMTWKDTMPYCTGPETEGERVLNLAKDFSSTFKNNMSFGIFWMNTFSHNYINSPMGMDTKVSDFFQYLKDAHILDDSIVFLLSDHGIRFGKLRQTIQGWFEERLPVNFISIPLWFKSKYVVENSNFFDNANKLISTYDLYMTLQDVLKKSVPTYNITPSKACPRCASLFSNIIRVRSCKDAGIPEAWCTCIGEFTTEDSRLTEETNNKAIALALKAIQRLEGQEPFSTSVTNIISSAVNLNRLRKSYLLLVIETNTEAVYQILFRIRGDPVDFVRIVKVMKLASFNSKTA